MQPSLWAEAHTFYTLRMPGVPQSGNLPFITYHSFVNTSAFRLTISLSTLLSANFSEPEIESAPNITRNSGINLTCSSKQGYPKPIKMYFWITNSTNEHDEDMQISQDNVTELFSISVSLSMPFPDDVFNVTALCVLETASAKIVSRPHYTGKPASQDYLLHQELHANLLAQPSNIHYLWGNLPAGC